MHKRTKPLFLFLFAFCCLSVGQAQELSEPTWISYPSVNNTQYGVYHFRKKATFEQVPEKLELHISADNRYHFFVNGQRICYGPAKGDLKTYKYDIIDIAPFLQEGENILSATVYNAGKDMAMSMFSIQTAFMLRAEDEAFSSLNSDENWKVFHNTAYEPVSYYEMLFKERWFYGYYACGPGDRVNAADYPWGWEKLDFDDSQWPSAERLVFESGSPWKLVPRNIPFMDSYLERPKKVRKTSGIPTPTGFIGGQGSISIPPNTKATILLDYELFTMGYPELSTDKGAGSSIQVNYAEALYEKVNLKAHRDSVNDLTMYGVFDIFKPDGQERTFRPLWKRAFRYVQLSIETADEELLIKEFKSEYSGYPYPELSTFKSDDERLNKIFDICIQTFRMCSGETYYDTPYYEQLSYGGDNRPIAAISMYNSRDDRLFREVMRLYPQSKNKETQLFKSAYPSRFDFDMGSWSLAWIQSLYDYYLVRGDADYVTQFVEDIEGVLKFYERNLDESMNILGSVRNQNFMDWSISKGSIPRKNEAGVMHHSLMLTMYYVHTLDCASALYGHLGKSDLQKKWSSLAGKMKAAVLNHGWNEEKQLIADHPGRDSFSQHTNLLAILSDVIPAQDQAAHLRHILTYEDFTEYASSYFSFILFKAMQKTGQEELFVDHLDFWYTYLDRGHTTAGETGFASHDRSDCHAWSAHPAYYLLNFVCGIKPASIGFETVEISPRLGDLKKIEASMPHKKGRIEVSYKFSKGKLSGYVILPEGLTGTWNYQGVSKELVSGKNIIKQ